ncbi:MAG: ABC transporter ATP-binding protein [bacterium]
MSESKFVVKNLHKNFIQGDKKVEVLRGIDAEFEHGKSYAVNGVSGSGKSTFLHILGRLDEPTSGDVLFDDKSIFKLKDKQRDLFLNQKIGFIFQFHYLIKELTVLQNIMLMGLIKGLDKDTCQKRAYDLLKLVGLTQKAESLPTQLSGGEQQRVSILRSIFNNPKFLLADEPTGNLDEDNAQIVINFLLKLKQDFGMGIILCSHDKAVYEKMDSIFNLHEGKLFAVKSK